VCGRRTYGPGLWFRLLWLAKSGSRIVSTLHYLPGNVFNIHVRKRKQRSGLGEDQELGSEGVLAQLRGDQTCSSEAAARGMGLGDPKEGQGDAPTPARSRVKSLASLLGGCPRFWSHRHRGCWGHTPHPGLPVSPLHWEQGCSTRLYGVADDIRFEDKYLTSEPDASAVSAAIPALPGSPFLNQSAFCMPSATRSQDTIKAEDQYIRTDYRYRIWSFSEQTVPVKLGLLL